MSRDLNQYNNQLKYAKKICEKRIKGFCNILSDTNDKNLIKDDKKFNIEREVRDN